MAGMTPFRGPGETSFSTSLSSRLQSPWWATTELALAMLGSFDLLEVKVKVLRSLAVLP